MEPDFFEKKAMRGPQVILKKDAGMIAAYSGASPGWKVLDAGSGSGFLAIFLGNIVQPGKVTTYEIKEDFFNLASKNIKRSGLENIEIINKDIAKARVKGEFDLITLDLRKPARLVKKLDKVLKPGGVFVVYSPNIEQIKDAHEEFTKLGYRITVIDCEVREWKVGISTHPIHTGLIHTGFLLFGYK
ncbi:MAG: methyltransferase domain-containing protein [Candidatus Aenigmarchaeota archaeon]|nr:methyltransferase domain-containing protein [Candidatus Aenigmarchaeota archaeon]